MTGDTKRVGGGAEEAMTVGLLRWRATVQHCNDNTKRVGGGAEEAMTVGLLRWRATVQHCNDNTKRVGGRGRGSDDRGSAPVEGHSTTL